MSPRVDLTGEWRPKDTHTSEEQTVTHVPYTEFRANLAAYMGAVCDSRDALVITRQNARSVPGLRGRIRKHAGDPARIWGPC